MEQRIKAVLLFTGTKINTLVEHLYNTRWVSDTINNVCRNLTKDKKDDLEQYIYLYILEHPTYFIRDNRIKPISEITYYLTVAIQNQYRCMFRNRNKEIVDSDYINKLANKIYE